MNANPLLPFVIAHGRVRMASSGALRRRLAVPLLGLLTAGMLLLISPALAARPIVDLDGCRHQRRQRLRAGAEPDPARVQQAAYPQYTLNYVGSATGVAIQTAESGNGSPSALIVHAASLENQFVGRRLLLQEPVRERDLHQRLRARRPDRRPGRRGGERREQRRSGVRRRRDRRCRPAMRRSFSRGGTNTASGTTVEEHEIWALVHSSGLQPAEPLAVRGQRRRRRRYVAGQHRGAERTALPGQRRDHRRGRAQPVLVPDHRRRAR